MDELSESDLTILQMTADGVGIAEIAKAVNLAERTIIRRRFTIQHKLGADNLIHAAAMAVRRRIIE